MHQTLLGFADHQMAARKIIIFFFQYFHRTIEVHAEWVSFKVNQPNS